MIFAIFALFILTLPALIARFFYRKERWNRNTMMGVFQDFFVGGELLFLMWILPDVVFSFFLPTIEVIVLFDALLYQRLSLRMEPSFFLLLPHYKEYSDSAKALRGSRSLPIIVVLSILPLLLLELLPDFRTIDLFVLGGTVIGGFYLLKEEPPRFENILYRYQRKGGRRLLALFREEAVETDYSDFVAETLLSPNEIYAAHSITHPLFRYTEGFSGEKTFHLEVEKKPHVMFLYMESLRSCDMERFGGPAGVVPYFEKLATQGIFFSQFYSNSLFTVRSVLSGVYGIPHHVEPVGELDPNLNLVGMNEIMRHAGYDTHAMTGGSFANGNLRSFFRQQSICSLTDKNTLASRFPDAEVSSWGIPDEYLFSYVMEHLKEHRDTPQFYSIFPISNHHPWMLPGGYEVPEFGDGSRTAYNRFLRTLHYSDAQIGQLIEGLRSHGLLEDTLLFIFGDHGMVFDKNDSGQAYHHGHAEENFHVPLLIYTEGGKLTPQVIDTPGSQFDLMPTLMDLLNLSGFNVGTGSSLMRKEEKKTFFFHNPASEGPEICVRSGNYKGVFSSTSKEFNLYRVLENRVTPYNEPNDPGRRNLRDACSEYRHFLYSLYDSALFLPSAFSQNREGKFLRFSPSKSYEELAEEIKKKSPIYALFLNHQPALSDTLIEQIAVRSPNLGVLELQGCGALSNHSLSVLGSQCPNISQLDLSECSSITGTAFAILLDRFKHLERLCLNGFPFLSDAVISQIGNRFHAMKRFEMMKTPVTDRGLKRLAYLFPRLTQLALSFEPISKLGIRDFLTLLPVTHLTIDGGERLKDEDFLSLVQSPHFLHSLKLTNCSSLTESVFHSIKQCSLKELVFEGVPALNDEGVKALEKLGIPRLKVESESQC